MSSRSPNSSLCSSKDDGSNFYFENSDDGSYALLGERIISFSELTPLVPNGNLPRLPPYVSNLRDAKADDDDSTFDTGIVPHSYQHDYLINYDQGGDQEKQNVGKGLGLLERFRFQAISSSPYHCDNAWLQPLSWSSASSRRKCIFWSILTMFVVAGVAHYTTSSSFSPHLLRRHEEPYWDDDSYWDDIHGSSSGSRWHSNSNHRNAHKHKNETRFIHNSRKKHESRNAGIYDIMMLSKHLLSFS